MNASEAKYNKVTTVNGEPAGEEVVTQSVLDNFTSRETLRFFRNLGGTETVRRYPNGRVVNVSTSPDGETVRRTVFTPIGDQ